MTASLPFPIRTAEVSFFLESWVQLRQKPIQCTDTNRIPGSYRVYFELEKGFEHYLMLTNSRCYCRRIGYLVATCYQIDILVATGYPLINGKVRVDGS